LPTRILLRRHEADSGTLSGGVQIHGHVHNHIRIHVRAVETVEYGAPSVPLERGALDDNQNREEGGQINAWLVEGQSKQAEEDQMVVMMVAVQRSNDWYHSQKMDHVPVDQQMKAGGQGPEKVDVSRGYSHGPYTTF
jgi:hypothetical protein